jgi:hypothetical protein
MVNEDDIYYISNGWVKFWSNTMHTIRLDKESVEFLDHIKQKWGISRGAAIKWVLFNLYEANEEPVKRLLPYVRDSFILFKVVPVIMPIHLEKALNKIRMELDTSWSKLVIASISWFVVCMIENKGKPENQNRLVSGYKSVAQFEQGWIGDTITKNELVSSLTSIAQMLEKLREYSLKDSELFSEYKKTMYGIGRSFPRLGSFFKQSVMGSRAELEKAGELKKENDVAYTVWCKVCKEEVSNLETKKCPTGHENTLEIITKEQAEARRAKRNYSRKEK